MFCIPQLNHQKLVTECYPAPKALAGTAPEYRPNSNELGRLSYYAKYKPAKLSKVGRLLAARATADKTALRTSANPRSKAGLMITLGIVQELVDASPGGLTYLAPALQTVVRDGLQAAAPGGGHGGWDADLCTRATSTFAAFMRALPQGAMEVDEGVPVCVYADLAELQPLVRGNVDEHTRITGLGALEGVVRSSVLYSPAFSQLLQGVLPGVLDSISPTHLPLERTAALAGEDGNIRVPSITERPADAEMSTAAALVLLRHIVQGADAVQIRLLVHQTLAWLDEHKGQAWAYEDFCVWLLNIIALWTPRASRYVVPHTLVDVLSSTAAVNANAERSTRLLQALHEILANKIQIVGLNMTELLEGHVYFLLAHVQHNPNDPTIAPTINAIGYLAQYTMYSDQLSDFVQQINTNILTVQSSSPPLPPVQRDNSLRALLYAQMAVVRSAYAEGMRADVPLTAWRGTESLLLSPTAAVRFTYLQALLAHLDLATKAQRTVQLGEANYAPESEVMRFLHSFTAYAYIVLARANYAPGASLDEIKATDSRFDVAQLTTGPADYVTLLAVLQRLYDVVPAPALLATVPALLALDHLSTRTADVATRPAACAARWVVGHALLALAGRWEAPNLASYVQAHVLQPLGHVQLHAPAFPAQFGAAPEFAAFGAGNASAGSTMPDVETVAEHLAVSSALQTATNCDTSTLRNWLLRNWSTTVAVQDAETGAQPVPVGAMSPRSPRAARSPARVPTAISREGSVSVSQLRMALANRAPSRTAAPAGLQDPDASLGDTRSTLSRRRRSRSQTGQLSTQPSLTALLDKYKGGDQVFVSPSAYGSAAAAESRADAAPGAPAVPASYADGYPVTYGAPSDSDAAAVAPAAGEVPLASDAGAAPATYDAAATAPAQSEAPVSYTTYALSLIHI